jgi:type II secretion system protein H
MRRAAARRGVTFLELLVVLTILAMMVAVAFPSMRGMNEHNKLRATARELIALFRYARSEAVFGERTTQVYLDLEKRQYWLDLRTPDPEKGEYIPGRNKNQFEQKRNLNKDVWFEEITTRDENVIRDKIVALDFYPDGSASPAMVTVANRRGSMMTIELVKSTGLTELSKGSIADLREKRAAEAPQAPGTPQ